MDYLLLLIGFVLLIKGADFFVEGSASLAKYLKVPSVIIGLTIVAIGENTGISPITGAVVGSLLGFLLFNVYPAKVFMGDTGSLALGGFVSASVFMMRMPLFLPIIGFIYLAEVLSVIIQVTYFKKTGGKRFFRMAPIHHHFELGGWSETRVVAVFSIVTAILCLVAYLGL